MRRLIAGLVASMLALTGLVVVAAGPAAAFPSAHVDFVGHGFGHGRGMGQYGALGYALGGMAYGDILQHYYSNTTAGSMNNDLMTVELMGDAGFDTIVQQEKGHLATTAGAVPAAAKALRVQRVGVNVFNVQWSGDCGGAGGWQTVANGVAGPVRITPTAPSPDHSDMLQVCNTSNIRWYEGAIITADGAGTIHKVNELPIETYLHGVVPRESPASWGQLGNGQGEEALKAQAVAARSYAAAENRSAWAKTCDTTSCQVYGGRALQDGAGYQDLYGAGIYSTTSDAAVAATAGQVRILNNAVARTEFSSSTGGYTAGGVFPPVIDDGDATPSNPNHTWQASVPVATIEAAFNVGSLVSIEVLTRNGLGDIGGRVLTIKVTGSTGSTTVSGTTFQAKLGLKSDWFRVVSQPSGGLQGYWLLGSDGGIFSFGNAGFHGSMGGQPLNKPIITMASIPSGNGYWLVASDGGIFSFDAPFFGSTGGIALNQPIVGMTPTPSGNGYWMVASDGGIFSFGDAKFLGSMGGKPLNKPIVGMASTPSGNGYWLVASDGGIFTFGDATFHGSTGGITLARPIVGMAPGPSNTGYWLMGSDGGIFAFDVPFRGSLPGSNVSAEATAIKRTRTGNGYLVATATGGVYSFGDAPADGGMDTAVPGYRGRIIGMDGQPSAS
jgi:SpoIID/LytB domain protein